MTLTPNELAVLRWIAAGDESAPPPDTAESSTAIVDRMLTLGMIGPMGEVTDAGMAELEAHADE